MAKITFNNKSELYPAWDEEYQFTSSNSNEIKASVNDLYDIVGAGAVTDNLIVVSINTGGTINKIKDTLDSITTSSSTNTYLVSVRPGIYIEDNFIIPEYVALISAGTDRVTEIQANITTGILATVSPNVTFQGFTISGKTLGTAISYTSIGECKIDDFTFYDCATCIDINNASAEVVISRIDFNDNITTGINVDAGNIDVNNVDVYGSNTVATVINTNGSNSRISIHDLLSTSSSVTTLMNITNGCFVAGISIQAQNVYDGIVISGNDCEVQFNSMKIYDAGNDGIRIESTGTGIKLSMFDTTITRSINYNINFLNSTCIAIGNGFSEIENFNLVPGARIYAYILDLKEGDEGVNILGELHVGSTFLPVESAFGEGDSHTLLAAYTTTDDISFTDITAEVKSYSGSTFTFPSTAVGSSIYLYNLANDVDGNPLPFFGIRSIVDTASVLGAGNFTIQYYNSVSGWIDLNYMETQSSDRFYQYADNIFTHTGTFHIRNDINLAIEEDANLIWEVYDPCSYGENRYVLRLLIENAITTAPIFEQFKIHSNRTEINSDGWMEYFMNARIKQILPITLGAGRELSGSMANANIWIDEDLGEGLIDNQFSSITQYFGFSAVIPNNLDTSCGINLVIACRGDAAGVVTLKCDIGCITEGDTVYTSNPSLGPIPSRKTYTSTKTFTGVGDVRYFDFKINTRNLRARKDPSDGDTASDIFFVTINPTVLPVNIQMMHVVNYYFAWSNGEHI